MSGRIEDRLKALRSLPQVEPPTRLEATTLEAMATAASARRSPSLARAAAWAGLIVAGGLLASLALNVDRPEEPVQAASPIDEIYLEYAEAAAGLEALLAQLPEPRRVMRADTASTIVGLEDRIAVIDAELVRAEAEQDPPEYRVALMRDRVEAMNALVHVRYAQSRAFIF